MPDRSPWDKLADPAFRAGRLDFAASGATIAASITKGPEAASTLIVWLHAAVDRVRKRHPFLAPHPGEYQPFAHQISVADPTLDASPDLMLAWYIGSERLDTQSVLREFFSEVRRTLGVERTIYIGASGGGFAALYFSRADDASCAIALQPQTVIASYRGVPAFLASCWPARTLKEVGARACVDIAAEYAKGFRNAVVYVQSIADTHHFRHHLTPFQAAIRARTSGEAIFHVDFWGATGHAPVPRPVVTQWVLAAVGAPSLRETDILVRRHALAAAPAAAVEARTATAWPDADVRIADQVRKALLA